MQKGKSVIHFTGLLDV